MNRYLMNGRLMVPGLKNAAASAELLASGTKLAAKVESGGLTLSVPATAPDAISSTIVLRVKGALNIE